MEIIKLLIQKRILYYIINKSTNESKKHSANSSVNEIKFEKNIIYIPRFKQSIKLKNYLG